VTPTANSPGALRTVTIWLAATLSGGAALAYEIAWSRALVVPLGNSSDASALVLAAFMLGIGAGAHVAGGLAEKVRSPLRLYAIAEVILGAYALVAPHVLAQLAFLPGDMGGLLRRIAALLVILAPCLAMGATLPLLVRALTRPNTSLDLQVGIAYGANTAGAAIGAIVTGFWGLALLGTSAWSSWAALGSFAAAMLAFAASTNSPPMPTPLIDDPKPSQARSIALVAAFVMGFVMLANEMLWARVLTFVFGHDTYAFATLLAFVLVGLALGGLTHRVVAKMNQANVIAWLLGGFGVVSLASFWIAAHLVVRFGRDPFHLEGSGAFATSLRLELFRELAYTPILLLVPSILAGAAFPAACSLFGRNAHDVGRRVGSVALVNGTGAAAGALAAALGLATLTGIQGAFLLLALLAAITASFVVLASRPISARSIALALLPPAASVLIGMLMPSALPRAMILASVGTRHQVFLHYEEARTGTVSVIENQINDERQLLMNAVNEVTTRLVHDQSFKVLGHLAPLLHPDPKRGVMICLGAGISAGAALTHPLERLDVVDLSSAVARGARSFTKENNGVLDDPRFHLHVDDGRQFLLNTRDRYDVAIIDSTHPKAVDSWILYTLEFYRLVRDRLAVGGIAIQWLPLHGLSEREFKIIVRTFLEAFPDMTLWANVGFETYGQVGYAKLVGGKDGPVLVDHARLSSRLASTPMGKDLAAYGMEGPEELLDLFIAGPEGISRWTETLPVQTDDHPIVPYTTRHSLGRRMVPSLLLGVREPVTPWLTGARTREQEAAIERAAEAQGLVISGRLSRASELRPNSGKIRMFVEQTETTLPYYLALADRYPDDVGKLFESATQLAQLGHAQRARPIYEQSLALRPKDFRMRLDYAHLLLNLGETMRALEMFTTLRGEHASSGIVHFNLGEAVLAMGDAGVAAGHFETSLAWDPSSVGARLALSRARLALGDLDRSEAVALELLKENPWDADVQHVLGHVHARRGEFARAEEYHEGAQRLDPYRPSILFDLGMIRMRRGRDGAAEQAFRSLLRYEPHHSRGMVQLGQLLSKRGLHTEAAEVHLHALEEDPSFVAAAMGLGEALRAQGRADQARDAFCLALRLEPGHREAAARIEAMDAACDVP
jgi:spermidine synthase/tetratricopeptide (TPR) repeat protein